MPGGLPPARDALAASLRDMEMRLTALETFTRLLFGDTGWLVPVFENGWKNLGAGFLTAAYRLQGNQVRLRGAIASGASGTNAFTLPEGFRPTATTFSSIPQSGFGVAVVEIGVAGGVDIQMAGAEKTVGLDGITFTID